MTDFAYDGIPWANRARVAQEAADELKALSDSLKGVLTSNYFGDGCEEGDELYAKLSSLIKQGTQELRDCAADAHRLAIATKNAQRSISSTENSNAREFSS